MASTSPDGIVSPDSDQPVNWVGDWAATASSVQTALSNRSTRRGTSSQRTSATGVREGTLWSDTTTNSLWLYTSGMWVEAGPSYSGTMTGSASGFIGSTSSGVTIAESRFLRLGSLITMQVTATGTFTSGQNTIFTVSSSAPLAVDAIGSAHFSESGYQSGTVRIAATNRQVSVWKEGSGNRSRVQFGLSFMTP